MHLFSKLTAQMILGHGTSLFPTVRHQAPCRGRGNQPKPDSQARSKEAIDLTNGARS